MLPENYRTVFFTKTFPGDRVIATRINEFAVLALKLQRHRQVKGMKPLRILIVEDSPSEIRLAREALKEAGNPVELAIAQDGVEALDYLQSVVRGAAPRPDIVLLDLNLPRKNGREVLAEVKAAPNLKHIPIVVMTNSRADDDIRAAYSLNANCYIAKPADLDEYIEVIRAIENFWFFTAKLPGCGIEDANPLLPPVGTLLASGAAQRELTH